MMNNQGRPTAPEAAPSRASKKTFTTNRALQIEEGLIFEHGRADVAGVDIDEPAPFEQRLGGLLREEPIGLPGLSEPEAMRHYVRLSQKNHSIDANMYPLGSCTMKHNPRINEAMARLPGFADIHPLQPQSTVRGALELIDVLAHWLMEITGTHAVAMSPKAGAHGELCGMMAIRAAIDARGEAATRKIVLAPDSAHGTNPATAAMTGFSVRSIATGADGVVSAQAARAALGPDVAAIMLTNPNTCGLFERGIVEIADAVHAAGAYFYCDGANLNALMGKTRPGDLGVDAMHINLHKTFSTPHGGGGPGAGPVVFSERLAPFAPVPFVAKDGGLLRLVEHAEGKNLGRMSAFHGQMGMFVRALSFMMSHGGDGLKQASEDAVLNANYARAGLADVMTQPFGDRVCMHEVLFDDKWLEGTGVATLDFAKAIVDEGFHPMTMYFPLVAHGAMLIEPTESESLASLDLFIATLRELTFRIRRGETEAFHAAPALAPRGRLDETRAARRPVLRWTPPNPA